MSGFSTYLAQNLVNYILRGQAFTPPAGTYLALFIADPTDNNITANELNANGTSHPWYGRRQVTAWAAPTGSGTSTSNSNQLTFPAVTGSAVTVSHWGLYDALTSGNLLASGSLPSPVVLNVNDVFVVNADDLDLDFV